MIDTPTSLREIGNYATVIICVAEHIGSEIIGSIPVTNYFNRNNWFWLPVISIVHYQLLLLSVTNYFQYDLAP